MPVSRVAIEHALDAIVSDEGGMRFQGLAVVLAKLRWPELIACERKKDLGLDAHAPAILSPLHAGMGLSSSITPELEKIQGDAARAKPHFSDLQILIFVTSGKVTNYTVEQRQAEIKKEYGWDLIVMSREEIITTLQVPSNIGLCAEHLGIAIPPPEPTVEALIQNALAANGQIIANWSRRLGDNPIIDLRLLRLDDKGAETQEVQQRAGLHELLSRSHRVVFEAPAGRGKTTTLIQLAREQHAQGKIAFLIDLPAWVRRNVGVFEFIAGTPEFQARSLTAGDLARVHQAGHIVFLLNGWNELAVSESATAAGMFRDLERSFAGAGIAVATRAHPIAPPLPGSSRFRIQPLTRQERGDNVRTRLGDGAQPLIEQFRADRVLDDLTRTPMILAEVISLFQAGKKIPTSRLGFLDERALYVDALRRGMGEMTYPEVRAGFEARVASGEFKEIAGDAHNAGRRFTTAATIKAETEAIQKVQDGRNRAPQIMSIASAVPLSESHPQFNAAQKRVVEEVLPSRDRVQGLQGRAGSGKTSVLATIREGAEKHGYAVEGFAPTSRAAKQLRDAGIKADTLQRFLAGGDLHAADDPANKHFYMVDESSLASTQQIRDFLNKMARRTGCC